MCHLGSSDVEIHGMVDCQGNKMLCRCKVEHLKHIQFEDFYI